MNNNGELLARQLINGLTSEQLIKLVTQLLDNMSEMERIEFCDLLDPDICSVFHRLLAPLTNATINETIEITSDAKFTQQFEAKLSDIECLLLNLGDEDGEYIYQERHWDPPDFDASKLARDIERYARDLLPLLDHASELDLADKNWFMNLCQQITDGIDSYPEYIYTEEGICFEHTATECVLKWLDLHTNSEANFVDDLVALMNKARYVSLDDDTIRKYLLEGWDDDRRRALYHAIQNHRASDAEFELDTDNPRMLWYNIRYALAGEFDIAGKTEIAEASVAKDWTKGIGLVDEAVADGNATKALEFCRKTVDAYFNNHCYGQDYSEFDPETNPLLGQWSIVNESAAVPRILKTWAVLAAGDGDTVLAEYLIIQEALLARTDNWTAIKHAFDKAVSADTSILFSSWKKQTLDRQSSSMYLGGSTQPPIWVEWLIDAGFADNFEAFAKKAVPWLSKKVKPVKRTGRNIFAQQRDFAWSPQMSLAADLFTLDTAPKQYHTLKAMLSQHCKLHDCPARLEWLKNTDVAKLTTTAITFIRHNMNQLIPSPEYMSGNYETAAGWLAVAREVAPNIAHDTLCHWQDEYKRRRNLWRDLRTHGFDV